MCGFSAEMTVKEKALKQFLWANMYRHAEVARNVGNAQAIVRRLFDALLADPKLLPKEWQKGLDEADKMKTARRVADYIAGMTDRYAQEEHQRIIGPPPPT
jgi:dGTPase